MIEFETSANGEDFDLTLPALELEAGGRVDPHVVRGWTWGPENRNAPAVLIIHALTGDARADSWWGPVVGPGKVLDPTKMRLYCFNLLGSCYGTSGPASTGFPPPKESDGSQGHGHGAAPLTSWDQARSILLALDALGVKRLHLCVGGSLGGMIALCVAALAPDRVERLAPIAATAEASSWVVGWNHVARNIIRLDPGYPAEVTRGLSVARQLAMLTYRAEPGLDRYQPRSRNSPWEANHPYPIQSYLEYQGQKLVARFDGRSYLSLLDAMDHHDLSRQPKPPGENESWRLESTAPAAVPDASPAPKDPSPAAEPEESVSWGLNRIRASVVTASIDTDELFFPEQTARFAHTLRQQGRHVEEHTIQSIHGHDAFLLEWDQLTVILARALILPLDKEYKRLQARLAGDAPGPELVWQI